MNPWTCSFLQGLLMQTARSAAVSHADQANVCSVPLAEHPLAALHSTCRDELPREKCASIPRDRHGSCLFPLAEHCVRTCRLCTSLFEIRRCRCPSPIWASQALSTSIENYTNAVFTQALTAAKDMGLSTKVHSRDPWIVELQGFLRTKEISKLEAIWDIDKKSVRTQVRGSEGDANYRHRLTLVCSTDRCKRQHIVSVVYERTSQLLGIPSENFEHLLFFKYEVGHKYRSHHDVALNDNHTIVMSGPRLVSIIFSFRHAKKGGSTCFPALKKCFRPAPGNALLWANLRDHDPPDKARGSQSRKSFINTPWAIDRRTFHTAEPVKKGLKMNANFWVHTQSYEVANIALDGMKDPKTYMGKCKRQAGNVAKKRGTRTRY